MKSRLIIIAALTILTTVAWFVFLFRPALHKKYSLSASIQESSQRLDDISRIVLDTPEFYRKYKELLSQKKSAESQLYSREDLIRLFADLDSKARSHSLNLTEITPSIEELLLINRNYPGDGEPQILHLSVIIKGYFVDAGEFIGEIEKENFYQGLDFFHIANNTQGNPHSEIQYAFKAVLGTIRDSL